MNETIVVHVSTIISFTAIWLCIWMTTLAYAIVTRQQLRKSLDRTDEALKLARVWLAKAVERKRR